ncbi:Tn7-like element transposition protein TnsE [Clostridium felsineum]|uniref:TnsE C-terminal domain-containing protein n=1 Tax=Clostridium felsineum TaxID=36839 RepID=A0A1S8L720_9CLOT|nr:Tn7-like element transposition protein TnsE [Clostridium felsineum]URZ04705.1 hypothetical protein CLROS_000140 [Clostridium felsineum]URZ09678.1 hypothetical protein CROST_003710 [Clostridium felsineum]
MIDDRECSLIEVEREGRALSMLMLKAEGTVNWEWIYSRLLIGLVDGSGTWRKERINYIINNIIIKRMNHMGRKRDKNLNFLYYKLFMEK